MHAERLLMNFPSERILRMGIAFIAALGIGVATYIFIADSTAGAPTCLVGGRLRDRRPQLYSHIAGINIAVFGIIGWVLILATAFFGNDYAASPASWSRSAASASAST